MESNDNIKDIPLSAIYIANLRKTRPRMNMNNKKCAHPQCIVEPIFNHPSAKVGLYCKEHKLEGMVDIKNMKCIHGNCKTRANYNVPGMTKGIYCAKHQKDGMLNVVYKLCPEPGCGRIPQFNLPTERKGLYCALHKTPEMVNVKKKTLQDFMHQLEVQLINKRVLEPLINKTTNSENSNNEDTEKENEEESKKENEEVPVPEVVANMETPEEFKDKSMFDLIAEYGTLDELDLLMMNAGKVNRYEHLFKHVKSVNMVKILITKLVKKIEEGGE